MTAPTQWHRLGRDTAELVEREQRVSSLGKQLSGAGAWYEAKRQELEQIAAQLEEQLGEAREWYEARRRELAQRAAQLDERERGLVEREAGLAAAWQSMEARVELTGHREGPVRAGRDDLTGREVAESLEREARLAAELALRAAQLDERERSLAEREAGFADGRQSMEPRVELSEHGEGQVRAGRDDLTGREIADFLMRAVLKTKRRIGEVAGRPVRETQERPDASLEKPANTGGGEADVDESDLW